MMQPNDRTNLYSRTQFLRTGATLLGAAALGGSALAQSTRPAEASQHWKGKAESKVKRWDVITIGNLSRNRYWGESNDKAYRSVICTCTLIRRDDFRLLVDPAVADAAEMARELDRRSGLKPADITACFVTHEHGDHSAGLANFPEAQWFASAAVAEALNKGGKFSKKLAPAEGRLLDAVDVIPTPGHTPGHHSLRFDCEGISIVTAGDAVATIDFFRNRQGFYNSADFQEASRSMDKLAAMADIIVPGHDNYFLV